MSRLCNCAALVLVYTDTSTNYCAPHAMPTQPPVFYDVTVGDNRCGEYLCCPLGYETAVGFDAATGLGSIGDFAALRKLVLALP